MYTIMCKQKWYKSPLNIEFTTKTHQLTCTYSKDIIKQNQRSRHESKCSNKIQVQLNAEEYHGEESGEDHCWRNYEQASQVAAMLHHRTNHKPRERLQIKQHKVTRTQWLALSDSGISYLTKHKCPRFPRIPFSKIQTFSCKK